MKSVDCNVIGNNVQIRLAQVDDLPALLELYRELEEPYGEFTCAQEPAGEVYRCIFEEISKDKNQHLLVAVSRQKLVGTVTLVVVPNLGHRGRPWGAIDNLVVHKGYRGRGLGRRLIAAAASIARKRGCYKLVLSSNLQRTGAHRFYEKLGWRVTHLGFELSLSDCPVY